MKRTVSGLLVASVMLALALQVGAQEKKAEAKAEFVGSKKCMMCHVKEHKSWAETAHAKAFASLKASTPEQTAKFAKALEVEVKGNPADNAACIDCHVTGYKEAGGYPAADSLKNVALAAVGCESCHGPGSLHVKAAKTEKKATMATAVGADQCKTCHTAAMSPKFDFATAKKTGVHAVPAAAPAK